MVSRSSIRSMAGVSLLLGAMAWSSAVLAQDEAEPEEDARFPSVAGGEIRFGPVFPGDAGRGWSLGLDADLGLVLSDIRAFAGYTGLLGVDVDRDLRGEPIRGDLTVHGLRAGTRVDFRLDERWVPYVSTALVLYRATTDALEAEDEGDLQDLYGGNRLGGSIALGVLYPLEDTGQILALGELRRAYVSSVGNWTLDAGVRVHLAEQP